MREDTREARSKRSAKCFAKADRLTAHDLRVFAVTKCKLTDQTRITDFDIVIFLMAEESTPLKGRIFFDWTKLADGFLGAMDRPWPSVPTVVISLGHPNYLYDVPRMPCLVDAYSLSNEMQRAVVDCLVGKSPFLGRSPVEAFCGLDEARF